MTIEQANSYFEALPDGFASTDQLRAALPASAQKDGAEPPAAE